MTAFSNERRRAVLLAAPEAASASGANTRASWCGVSSKALMCSHASCGTTGAPVSNYNLPERRQWFFCR